MTSNKDMPAMPIINDCGTVKRAEDIDGVTRCYGLSKLEHFAGLAMKGILSGGLSGGNRIEYEVVAAAALFQAKVLLAQLEEKDCE